MVRIQKTLKSDCLIWLMLHRMMVGKNTSERGAVVVSMVVTTVLLVKSLAAMKRKNAATHNAPMTMRSQI